MDKLDSLLRQNPHGIGIVDAAKKIGVERSTAYSYLASLDSQGKARYEKGIAYPIEPREKKSKTEKRGFFGCLGERTERKQELEDSQVRELQADIAADYEIAEMDEDDWSKDKDAEIRRKWRKFYGLDNELPDNI